MRIGSAGFRLSVLVIVLLCISCASQIGNRGSLNTTFQIGKTTKNDVANALGFPAKMKTDESSQLELWAYQSRPTLTSVIYALPIPGTTHAMIYNHPVINRHSDILKNAAVVYIFNNNGVLTAIQRNQ
ncbi:MAG: hypothetical protein GY874_05835 [Desulfobacteraceae bacterium]|nr:hypothetical protein [Desulfobacteraceae bacterium]